MKMLYRSVATAGLLVFLAAAAHAQTPAPATPETTPPPPPGPLPERTVQGPEGIPPDVPERDEPWSFSLGVNGSYEGNALFAGPSDDNQFSHMFQGSIGRSWRLRRGDAQFSGTASQAFYQDTASLNDFRFSVTGGLGHMITRRLNWAGNASLSSGLARDSQVLTDAGIVLPSTATARTSTGSSLFSYALTPRSSVSWSVTTTGVGFAPAALHGGSNLTTAGTYTQQVGRGHTVGATVDYSRVFDAESSTQVYGALGTWAYGTAGGWVVFASGGVRPFSLPRQEGLRVTSSYNAGVAKPVRRNQTLGVTYSKTVEQAFGLREGNNIVQMFTGTYSAALHRNLTASASGSLTQAKDPVVSSVSNKGVVAQGTLGYNILRNLSVSVGSAYYARETVTDERTTSTTTFLALMYNTTWR